MWLRRAVYWVMFPSVIALPAWLLIGRAIFGDAGAWALLGNLFLAAALFIGIGVTVGMVYARRSVRTEHAVSPRDAAVITALVVAGVAAGIYDYPLLFVAEFLLVVALFWVALTEFLAEAAARVRGFVDGTVPVMPRSVPSPAAPPQAGIRHDDPYEVIVIEPRRD